MAEDAKAEIGTDDLMRMLDLDAPVEQKSWWDDEPASEQPNKEFDTCVVCDFWTLRRGRELAESKGWRDISKEVLLELAEKAAKEKKEDLSKVYSEMIEASRKNLNDLAAADFHALCFDPRVELQPCSHKGRQKFVDALIENPEFHALHESTICDDLGAQIAAIHLGTQYAKYIVQNGDNGEGDGDGFNAMRMASRAVKKAGEEVEEMNEIRSSFGGDGGEHSKIKLDLKTMTARYQAIRKNPSLKRIATLAGAYRRLAQARQRQKDIHGLDETVGIVPGNNLNRLLVSELALLGCGIEEMETEAIRRLVEKESLCRDLNSVVNVGKGPIIVVIDESGSMTGTKVENAKALALAMAWIARQQRRWCALIAYSGGTGHRLLPMPMGQCDNNDLMEFMSRFLSGGSSRDLPIDEMPTFYDRLKAPVGKTDVLMVTDALLEDLSEVQIKKWNAWKKRVNAKVTTLIVEYRGETATLDKICDEIHQLKEISVGEYAISKVLSL